jgi:hypothetical protein
MGWQPQAMRKLLIVAIVGAFLGGYFAVAGGDDSTTIPPNTIFSVGLLFSGDTQENITACPWLFETNDSEDILGPNKAFRDYFYQDLSTELVVYPQILGIHMIEYTTTFNFIAGQGQNDPEDRWEYIAGENVSAFDPYYAHLRLNFDYNTTWDDQLARNIETMLLIQWYINQTVIVPDARVPEVHIWGQELFFIPVLAILTLGAIFRRKRQYRT